MVFPVFAWQKNILIQKNTVKPRAEEVETFQVVTELDPLIVAKNMFNCETSVRCESIDTFQ